MSAVSLFNSLNTISVDGDGDTTSIAITSVDDDTELSSDGGLQVNTAGELVFNGLPIGGSGGGDDSTGKILQVDQAVISGNMTTTSTSFTNIAGLTLNITPSAATSKILILSNAKGTNNNALCTQILRSVGGVDTVVGNGVPGTTALSFGTGVTNGGFPNNADSGPFSMSQKVIDSPATTAQITYQIQWRNAIAGTGVLNTTTTATNNMNISVNSTLTLMEIAGDA